MLDTLIPGLTKQVALVAFLPLTIFHLSSVGSRARLMIQTPFQSTLNLPLLARFQNQHLAARPLLQTPRLSLRVPRLSTSLCPN